METSLVASCLSTFIQYERFNEKDIQGNPTYGFIGTATQLKKELDEIAPLLGINIIDKDWPKKPNKLTQQINILMHTLKEVRIYIDYDRQGDKTGTRIIKIRKVSSEPSDRQNEENNHAQIKSFDDTDDTDDSLGTKKGKVEVIQKESTKVKCPDCNEETEPYYMKFYTQNTGHRDWRESI